MNRNVKVRKKAEKLENICGKRELEVKLDTQRKVKLRKIGNTDE